MSNGFVWDAENIGHLARHQIIPVEAEQVIQNRPVDLDAYLRNAEERTVQVGETDAGRILIVISTMLERNIRVITGWPAKERLQRYFSTLKKNGNVGRIAEEDLRE